MVNRIILITLLMRYVQKGASLWKRKETLKGTRTGDGVRHWSYSGRGQEAPPPHVNLCAAAPTTEGQQSRAATARSAVGPTRSKREVGANTWRGCGVGFICGGGVAKTTEG